MPLETARFSGHQSFAFRNTWLTKGVLECAANPGVFRADDALVTLGVGKNMVDAIKYWCIATRVIEPHNDERHNYQPSAIGRRLFLDAGGWDPYLEDQGTIWLLHWLLATNGDFATTAYYAFNEMPELEFSRGALIHALAGIATKRNVRATPDTLKRDVGVFVRSYAGGQDSSTASVEDTLDCPLAELKLLYEEPLRDTYAFARGPKDTLPTEVFFYGLCEFARGRGTQRSLTFDELAYYPGSPGRVFKLDEFALAERLEEIATLTNDAWQFTETAGLRQMTMRQEIDPLEILQDYYLQGEREVAHA